MKKQDLEALRGHNVTVNGFTFLFTRKPVRTQEDVMSHARTMARIDEEVEQLKKAIDIGKAVRDALDQDVAYHFKMKASQERNAEIVAGTQAQLTLWSLGDMVEAPTGDRAKTAAVEPKEPRGRKARGERKQRKAG